MSAEEVTFFDDESADKIARSIRELDRRTGEIPVPEDYRSGSRNLVVVVTGPADPANLGMYPCAVGYWRAGPLDTDDGHTPGGTVSYHEWDDNWSSEKNPDDETPDTGWLLVSSAGPGNPPVLEVGQVVPVIIVGEHPTDKTSVYLFAAPSGGCGLGVIFRQQLGNSVEVGTTTAVVSGTTVVTGVTVTLKQRFRDVTVSPAGCYTFGDKYCVTADATCTDGDEAGEEPKYWCVPGVAGSECYLVMDGITPAIGSGPYDTSEECHGVCDPENWPVVGTSCPDGYAYGMAGTGSLMTRTGPYTWEWTGEEGSPPTPITYLLEWDGVTDGTGVCTISSPSWPTCTWTKTWTGEFPDIPNGVVDEADFGGGDGGACGTDRWISCFVPL